jgi:hypothetical protein
VSGNATRKYLRSWDQGYETIKVKLGGIEERLSEQEP